MLYDRDKRTIHHVCIHLGGKSEKDVEDPLSYMLKIASQMKSDYYITFNTYCSLTDEAINQQARQKKYCCPEHSPPEFKMEIINVVGRSLANKNDKSSKRSSSIKEIDKTYEIIRERPGDQTSKVLDFNEL
jgi:hypothetical protein